MAKAAAQDYIYGGGTSLSNAAYTAPRPSAKELRTSVGDKIFVPRKGLQYRANRALTVPVGPSMIVWTDWVRAIAKHKIKAAVVQRKLYVFHGELHFPTVKILTAEQWLEVSYCDSQDHKDKLEAQRSKLMTEPEQAQEQAQGQAAEAAQAESAKEAECTAAGAESSEQSEAAATSTADDAAASQTDDAAPKPQSEDGAESAESGLQAGSENEANESVASASDDEAAAEPRTFNS